MLRLRQPTFRLIIVVCDISKRIMRMKCDKNYFHVTPEHLTSDRLARRSTEPQTSGTSCEADSSRTKRTEKWTTKGREEKKEKKSDELYFLENKTVT